MSDLHFLQIKLQKVKYSFALLLFIWLQAFIANFPFY